MAVQRSFGDVERTAEWLELPASSIETALGYYDAHRDEIDEWIRGNEEAAEAASASGALAGPSLELLLDEMYPSLIARELQARGHDVVSVHDAPGRGTPEEDVLEFACGRSYPPSPRRRVGIAGQAVTFCFAGRLAGYV